MSSILLNYSLPVVALLPFFGAFLAAYLSTKNRVASAWVAGIVTILAIALLLITRFLSEGIVVQSFSFIPRLGLDFAFRLDGLSLLFASIILFIGLFIVTYARYYLSSKDSMGRFYSYLLLFMGSMLGIVLSENIILLVIFWELTSLSSFLLISYWQHRKDGRIGARIALAITGGGGLALIAGVLMLGEIAGSYNLSVILESGDIIKAHELYTPMLLCVLIGVFTKSAQFPFHFWLPHAMAAPTPVSAYLHSATMVKAGIFLLARLFPALSGTDMWLYIVSIIGLLTLLVGAYTAFFRHDLKGLLAYSTVSHLGLITFLLGIGSELALLAALFHIVNHATFKASLFMIAGIIDHESGTRDIRRLNNLKKYMPHTTVLAIITSASMAGIPLFGGFLSKEMLFEQSVLAISSFSFILPLLVLLAAVFSVAYSIRFVHDVFFDSKKADMPKIPHEPPYLMKLPVDILAFLCIAIGILPMVFAAPVVFSAVEGTIFKEVEYTIALWHGFNIPLLMSALALIFGSLVYVFRKRATLLHEKYLGGLDAKTIYLKIQGDLFALSKIITSFVDRDSLQSKVAWIVGATIVISVYGFVSFGGDVFGDREFISASPIFVVAVLITIISSILTVFFHRDRLLSLIAMGVVGLFISIGFVKFSAPDLALTQLSVEIVTIVLLLLALHYLPQKSPKVVSSFKEYRDIGIAVVSGIGVMILTLSVLSRDFESISWFFLENSVSGGGGTNVVNVILVDFRGYDTLGEIAVLALAGIGIYAMFDRLNLKPPKANEYGLSWADDVHPHIMRTLTRILFPIMIVVAIYIFLRGHNLPGGGFISGLIVAVAIIVQYLSNGILWTSDRITIDMHKVIGSGLLIATFTGIVSKFLGYPFLTSSFTYLNWPLVGKFEIASAMGFDLGVFLVVVGASVMILVQIGRMSYFTHHSKDELKVDIDIKKGEV